MKSGRSHIVVSQLFLIFSSSTNSHSTGPKSVQSLETHRGSVASKKRKFDEDQQPNTTRQIEDKNTASDSSSTGPAQVQAPVSKSARTTNGNSDPETFTKRAAHNNKARQSGGQSSNEDNQEHKSEPPRKKTRGPSTSKLHANKIEDVLSTPYLEWGKIPLEKRALEQAGEKRQKQVPVPQPTESSGIELSSDEDSNEPSINHYLAKNSLQAEANRTVGQEIDDEYGDKAVHSDSDSSNDRPSAIQGASTNALFAKSEQSKANDTGEDEGSEIPGDDNAADLLAGFDSDGEDRADDEIPDASKAIALPNSVGKKTKKKLRKAAEENGEPGVVYVGRIPHGFYEHQMRAYFSQFGEISKLRLSRNRKTGASKHFAFIEFKSNEVARIVATSMDNYLMFGHILRCKYAPVDTLHPDVWKGANKRFKKVPYNKLEKRALEAPKTEDQWEKKIAKEQNKREAKAALMKKMGYDISLPEMKRPGEVVARRAVLQSTELILDTQDNEMVNFEPSEMLEDAPKKPKKKISKITASNIEEGKAALPPKIERSPETVVKSVSNGVKSKVSTTEEKKARTEAKAAQALLDAQLIGEHEAAILNTAEPDIRASKASNLAEPATFEVDKRAIGADARGAEDTATPDLGKKKRKAMRKSKTVPEPATVYKPNQQIAPQLSLEEANAASDDLKGGGKEKKMKKSHKHQAEDGVEIGLKLQKANKSKG